MSDEDLRRLLRRLETDVEPDPAFGDALFERLSTTAPARRSSRLPFVLLAAALLLAALAAGAVAGGLLQDPRSSEATPQLLPSPSLVADASPSATPAAPVASGPLAADLAYTAPDGVVPPEARVRPTESIVLYSLPGTASERVAEIPADTDLRAGETLVVEGQLWLRLRVPTGELAGFAPIDDSGGDLTIQEVTCPGEAPTLAIVGRLSAWERLACYGDSELVLEGYEVTGFGGYRFGDYSPAWLNGMFGELALGENVAIDESGFCCLWAAVEPGTVDTSRPAVTSIVGSHLRITGHFNDAASVDCRATGIPITSAGPEGALAEELPLSSEVGCRERFVMTAMEVLEAGPPPASPPPAPMNGLLPLGGRAQVVVDQLNVRADPGLSGAVVTTLSRGDVVILERDVERLPREVDNLVWYLVSLESGTETGWVAGAEGGTPYLVGQEVSCPIDAGDAYAITAIAALDPWTRASCTAGAPIVILNAFVYPGCTGTGWTGDGTYTPNWLTDDPCTDYWLLAAPVGDQSLADLFDLPFMAFQLSPEGPPLPGDGLIANVTGHFLDPAWEDCQIQDPAMTLIVPGVAQVYCQEQFVVDAFEVIGTVNLPN